MQNSYEQYRNRTYPSLYDKFFYREPPLPFGAPALKYIFYLAAVLSNPPLYPTSLSEAKLDARLLTQANLLTYRNLALKLSKLIRYYLFYRYNIF